MTRIGAMALLIAVSCCAARPAPTGVRSFHEGERVFRQEPRWLGGDAALTIPLSDERILWLFGDSFIAPADSDSRADSVLVRNSVAIQVGGDPSTASMRFHWQQEAGVPSSYFPEPNGRWYWPGHGLRLSEGPLAIFLYSLVDAPGQDLGFRTTGYAVALVANPDADPEQWSFRIVDAPAAPYDAVPATAVVADGAHIVGLAIRQQGTHAGYLVRFPAASLAAGNLEPAEWWAGQDRGWLSANAIGSAGPAAVMADAGAECSLHWDRQIQAFVHVASYGFGASVIGVRTAPSLTGPWTEPVAIYRPPESDTPRAFVYAAKAHPELGGGSEDELIITYATNSFEFSDLLTPNGERNLYWPRMVSLDRSALPLAEALPNGSSRSRTTPR